MDEIAAELYVHLKALCDGNYEHRYESIDMPCPGCYGALDAYERALAKPKVPWRWLMQIIPQHERP